MKHKLLLVYLIAFLIIIISSVIILDRSHQRTFTSEEKESIDSFVIHPSLVEYNKQGQIKIKVTASKATRFQPTGKTVFEKPVLITYTDDRTPIHIHADQATSDRKGEKIILQGNVVIHKLATKQHVEAIIKTTELTLFPKESRAKTDKFVTLSRPGMLIQGAGFTANLKTGQYQLLSQSKATYQPQTQKQSL